MKMSGLWIVKSNKSLTTTTTTTHCRCMVSPFWVFWFRIMSSHQMHYKMTFNSRKKNKNKTTQGSASRKDTLPPSDDPHQQVTGGHIQCKQTRTKERIQEHLAIFTIYKIFKQQVRILEGKIEVDFSLNRGNWRMLSWTVYVKVQSVDDESGNKKIWIIRKICFCKMFNDNNNNIIIIIILIIITTSS